jgi:hypothetical protein
MCASRINACLGIVGAPAVPDRRIWLALESLGEPACKTNVPCCEFIWQSDIRFG